MACRGFLGKGFGKSAPMQRQCWLALRLQAVLPQPRPESSASNVSPPRVTKDRRMAADLADELVELFSACQRVLARLGERDDELAETIRETCRAVERRLVELGVVAEA
jgi:hypothetical protein